MSGSVGDLWRYELRRGPSKSPEQGACVMDAVSWFEYGQLGDHPDCTCPVQAAWMRTVNDMLEHSDRQRLRPYIPRLAGTVDPSAVPTRIEYMRSSLCYVLLPLALSKSGDHDLAELVAAVPHMGQLGYDQHVWAFNRVARDARSPALRMVGRSLGCFLPALHLEDFLLGSALCAMGHVVKLCDPYNRAYVKTLFAVTDGLLAIGRQAPSVDAGRFAASVDAFGLAARVAA